MTLVDGFFRLAFVTKTLANERNKRIVFIEVRLYFGRLITLLRYASICAPHVLILAYSLPFSMNKGKQQQRRVTKKSKVFVISANRGV